MSILTTIGALLYGPNWQSELARQLDVNDRTMRRWVAAGECPSGVHIELETLVRLRIQELQSALHGLEIKKG